MTNNPFDDIVRQKANGHESAVPPDAWDNIKKKKDRKPFIWWILGLAIIAGMTGVYISHVSHDSIIALQQKQVINNDSTVLPKNNNSDNKNIDNNQQHDNTHTATFDHTIVDATKTDQRNSAISHHHQYTATQNYSSSSTFVSHHDHSRVYRRSSSTHHYHANRIAAYYAKGRISTKKKFSSQIHVVTSSSDGDTTADNTPVTQQQIKDNTQSSEKDISIAEPKKTVPVDSSTQSKKPLALTENTVKKKNTDQHKIGGLTIEASTTGILPVQQQGNIINTERITLTANSKTDYTPDQQKSSVQPAFAYNIAVIKQLNTRYKIGIGFQYLELKDDIELSGAETTTTYTPIQRLVTDSSGRHLVNVIDTTTATGNRTINAQNSYRFYSIPVFVQCVLHDEGSWSLSLDGGVYFNIADTYHNTIDGKWASTNPGTYNNKLSIDLFAGLRLARRISKTYSLFTEPVLRYGLLSQNSFIPQKIHQLGLTIGISYKLK